MRIPFLRAKGDRCASEGRGKLRLPWPEDSTVLELLDLQEVQLDRRLAAEDADQDLDLVPLRVDLVDRADELGERPVGDPDALALREGHPVFRCLDAHLAEDLLDLGLVERDRLAADAGDVRAADEARDAWRVADDEPAVRVEGHFDQHVARVHLLLDGVPLALADLDLVLHRDEDLEDLVLHAHRLDPVLEVGLDLVLIARVRVDHIPALVRALGLDVGGDRAAHENHVPTIPITPWNTWSQNATKTPIAMLTAKTSTVRLRVCANVGHETLRSSETASARKRRIRFT